MNCTNCGDLLGENCLEGGFCSHLCCAEFEHAQKLRENECLTVHMSPLDDGGYTVELHLRNPETKEVSEMTQNFDEYPAALRGLAKLCLTVADKLEEPE